MSDDTILNIISKYSQAARGAYILISLKFEHKLVLKVA